MNRAGLPDAGGWFARQYGREPDGIWFAPGRVNLMGGPDYTGTFVLPVTLCAGVCAAASRRGDGRIALVSRQAADEPVVLSIDTLEPGSVDGWAAYPAGVAWTLREAGYLSGGADVAIDANLPAGAGLSSSAALECAVALALTELYEVPVPGRELAALARRAENVFAGVPTGIMDQIAALLGRAGHALLLDCRAGTAEPVPFDPAAAGLTLLVIDTRVRHALGDGRYAERRGACEEGASALGVRSLRDVTDDRELARLDEPSLRRVCGHVVAETRRVLRAAELLRAGGREQVTAIGELLTASHYSLRDQFGVSWPQADEAVAAAIEAGAAGARMTGGGFGGCVVALVPADRAGQVRGAVTERFARHRWAAPSYLDGVPSDGGRRLTHPAASETVQRCQPRLVAHTVEPPRDDLVNRRRPEAHDEHPVQQLVPAAVIWHPVQLGDGERSAGGGPGLRARHIIHGGVTGCAGRPHQTPRCDRPGRPAVLGPGARVPAAEA